MGCASSLPQLQKKKVESPVQTTKQQVYQDQHQPNAYSSQTPQYQTPQYQTPQYQTSQYVAQPTPYSQLQVQPNHSQASTNSNMSSSQMKTSAKLKPSNLDFLREHASGLQKQFISWLNSNISVNFDALNAIDNTRTPYKADCYDMAYFLNGYGFGDYTRFDQAKHPKFFEKAAGGLKLADIYQQIATSFDDVLYFEIRVKTQKEIYKRIFVDGLPLDDYITVTLIVDDYVKSIKEITKYIRSKDLAYWMEPNAIGPHKFPCMYVVKLSNKSEDNKVMPIKVELLDYRSFFLINEFNLKSPVPSHEETKQQYAKNNWNWRATIESIYDHGFLDEAVYNACLQGVPEEDGADEAKKQYVSFQSMTLHPRYAEGITKQTTTENMKDLGKSLFNSVKNPLKAVKSGVTNGVEKFADMTKIKALGYNPTKLKGLIAFQPRMLEDHEVYVKSQTLIKTQQKFVTNYNKDENENLFASADIKNRCLTLKFFMEENYNEYQELLKGGYFKKWAEHFKIDYALQTLYNFITTQANNCLVKLDVKSEHGAIGKVFLRSKALNDMGRATVVSNNPKADILKLGQYLTKGNEFGFWYEDSSTVVQYPVLKIYIYYKANAGDANTFPFQKVIPVEIQFITPDLYFYYKNTDFHDNYELYRCLELKKNAYEKYSHTFQEVTGQLINSGLMDIKETFGKQPGYFKEKPINNSEFVSKLSTAAREYDSYGILNYSYKTQKMAYSSQFRQWECYTNSASTDGHQGIVKSSLNGLGTEMLNGYLFFNYMTNVHPLEFKTSMAIRMEVFLAMGFFMKFTSKSSDSFYYVLTVTKDHISWKKTNNKASYFSTDSGLSNASLEKDYDVKTIKPSHKKLHISTIWIYFDRNDLIQIKIDDRLITFDAQWPANTEKLDVILTPIIRNTALKSICVYDERQMNGSAAKYVEGLAK